MLNGNNFIKWGQLEILASVSRHWHLNIKIETDFYFLSGEHYYRRFIKQN